MLKLTEHVGITISLLYKQKTWWNSDIQNFYSEILNFRLFYAKNRNYAQFWFDLIWFGIYSIYKIALNTLKYILKVTANH